jgi:hypothetical protein
MVEERERVSGSATRQVLATAVGEDDRENPVNRRRAESGVARQAHPIWCQMWACLGWADRA